MENSRKPGIDIYSGYNPVIQKMMPLWRDQFTLVNDENTFFPTLERLNSDLNTKNVLFFFDHHYAFDAIPVGLAFARYMQNVLAVIIPYAVHLDMGVGREGQFSIRYRLRTMAFHWFMRGIQKNPNIKFLPVAREFEMDSPRMCKIVNEKFQGVNTKYIRTLIRSFSDSPKGLVGFLTPFSGIGFPDKKPLHPQLYRSILMVLAKSKGEVPIYFAGAYPDWGAFQSYYAPLFTVHKLQINGPFYLPVHNYEVAVEKVETELNDLRAAANFVPPDYDKLLLK
jgi:hypothetical protein